MAFILAWNIPDIFVILMSTLVALSHQMSVNISNVQSSVPCPPDRCWPRYFRVCVDILPDLGNCPQPTDNCNDDSHCSDMTMHSERYQSLVLPTQVVSSESAIKVYIFEVITSDSLVSCRTPKASDCWSITTSHSFNKTQFSFQVTLADLPDLFTSVTTVPQTKTLPTSSGKQTSGQTSEASITAHPLATLPTSTHGNVSSTISVTSLMSIPSVTSGSNKETGVKKGPLVGGIVGGVVFLVLAVVTSYCCWRHICKSNAVEPDNPDKTRQIVEDTDLPDLVREKADTSSQQLPDRGQGHGDADMTIYNEMAAKTVSQIKRKKRLDRHAVTSSQHVPAGGQGQRDADMTMYNGTRAKTSDITGVSLSNDDQVPTSSTQDGNGKKRKKKRSKKSHKKKKEETPSQYATYAGQEHGQAGMTRDNGIAAKTEALPSQEVIYSRQAYGQTQTATRDIETATKPDCDDESPPPSTSFSVTEDKKRKKKTSRKKKKEKGRNYKSKDEQTEREFPALQEVVRNYTPTDEQTERESTAIQEVGRNFTPTDEQRDRESSALQEVERTRHTTATPIESEEVMYARNQRQSLHQQTEVSQNCTDESTRTKKRKRKRKSYADEEPLIYILD